VPPTPATVAPPTPASPAPGAWPPTSASPPSVPSGPAAPSPAAVAPTGGEALVGRLRLDALVFAPEPADRMAFIDGQKYVEGQRLEGLTVESITQEGVVLTDGTRRFVLRPRLNPYAPPR
jgi:hypothetical protein